MKNSTVATAASVAISIELGSVQLEAKRFSRAVRHDAQKVKYVIMCNLIVTTTRI